MNTPPLPLTPREEGILRQLSRGWSYRQIREHLEITKENLHVHCFNIRRKTGIMDTKDAHLCREYLGIASFRKTYPHPHQKEPTAQQLEVMRLLAAGRTYPEIAQQLKMGVQTAMNHASAGCKRAHIFDRYRRTKAIREWLAAQNEESPTLDPAFT